MWRSILLSFTLQVIAIAAGVIVSILTVDSLGAFSLPQPMPPAPRPIRAVEIVRVQRSASTAPSTALHSPARPFIVPTRIPTGLPAILDGPEIPTAQFSRQVDPGDGVPGGVGPVTGIPYGSQSGVTTPPPAPPRQEEPQERSALRIGGNVLEAKLIKRVMPVYPPLARQMRLSGVVRLEGVIARDGRVVNLQVVSGHPVLAQAAVEAVRQWVYQPTLLNGVAVEVIAPIDVRFILSQ